MIDESTLTKGERRKLTALRRSVGPAIGDDAFLKWKSQTMADKLESDAEADIIAGALWPLVEEGKLKIRRGGYIVRRGRRRIIVEARNE